MNQRINFQGQQPPVDRGGLYGRTDAAPSKVGVIFEVEDGQTVLYDGDGNKTWLIDTTSGNVTITLPAASSDPALAVKFTVKRKTGGVNTLTLATEGGNIDGAATYSLAAQYLKVTVLSDGTDYWTI